MSRENTIKNVNLNLFYLVPFFFIIHNVEEAFTMAEWSRKVPGMIHPQVTSVQFSIAVIFLSLLGITATVLARYLFGGKYFVHIMCGFTALLIMNAFFPHILAAIYFKSYVPGLLTSIFLYVPFCFYAFYRVLSRKMIEQKNFILSFMIGTVSGGVLARMALYLGKQF